MRLKSKLIHLKYDNQKVSLERKEKGICEVNAHDRNSLAYAQGFAHANDRQVQMILTRVIGQGRLCELLKDSEETFQIDKFMRELCLYKEAKEDTKKLDKETVKFLEEYSRGVNDYLKLNKRPHEFIMTGLYPQKWRPEDTLLTIKMMSYIGLAQTQQDVEKLIIQMIKDDMDTEKLKNLFSPHLDNLEANRIDQIKKLKLTNYFIPKEIKLLNAIPKIVASNNWVLGNKKTKENSPIQCNDPHLECNRLPAIWYEMKLKYPGYLGVGITMPGVPGLIMGRTNHLSYGFTYGFMDMIDFFIEEVKDNKVRVENNFELFKMRKEVIKRKKHHDHEIRIRETDNGVLDYDSEAQSLRDGLYLSRAWSCHKDGARDSITAIRNLFDITTVNDFQKEISKVTISCNWLVCDNEGNIGYQQSGRLPKRSHSGLYPLFGHKKEERWQGIHEANALHKITNPETGYLVTANNDLNDPDGVLSINMPMGDYRARRIKELLEEKESFDMEDMKRIQTDLFSIQASELMSLFKDELSSIEGLEELKQWDFCYDRDSIGATQFETFYHYLLEEIMTEDFFSKESFAHLLNQTNILIDYYAVFDRFIFDNDPLWFKKNSRSDYAKKALERTLNFYKENENKSWGKKRECMMTNIFFDGALPKFLGYDYGPISLIGSRATIVQGALFQAHDRTSSFCPSYRYIAQMNKDKIYSVLAGGVSDRRFEYSLYTSEIEDWLNFRYKEVGLN